MFLKKNHIIHFQGMFGKTAMENSLKDVFSGLPFKQVELSNLPPITILKINFTTNVSCEFSETFQNCRKSVSGGITS